MVGGTCVNVGCVPKKLMHYASLCGEAALDGKQFGWEIKKSKEINWSKLVTNVQNHIKKLNFFYEKGCKPVGEIAAETGVDLYNALASFKSPTEVAWSKPGSDSGIVRAKHIIIATGGRPFIPSTPGAREFAITSDDLFSLSQKPGKTLVVGAGY